MVKKKNPACSLVSVMAFFTMNAMLSVKAYVGWLPGTTVYQISVIAAYNFFFFFQVKEYKLK